MWVEVVPRTHVAALRITPHVETSELEVVAEVHGAAAPGSSPVTVTVRDGAQVVGEATGAPGATIRLHLPGARLWSPADPHLYDLEVRHGSDLVRSYAALRSFGVGRDARGRRRFLLNGEPFQHVGILDQGYWPDGLLTPPSDEAVLHDLTTVKHLGFTMVRKHVKIEPLRWYHHCDRIGLLVWQDMVNGGGRYRHLVTTLPATRPVRISDRRHRLYRREDAAAREEFRAEVRRTVTLLRNVVSIAVWVPFNEGWGQFDANEIAAEVAALDPTRQVNHVSGWVDQGGGEVRSFHSYLRPFRVPRLRLTGRRLGDRRVLALTEYGGYSLQVPGHDWSTREFGYRHCESAEDLTAAFTALHHGIATQVDRGLAATVYTQLSDVEDELNGLLTWDREVLKIPAGSVRAALAALRRAADPEAQGA